jgi:hypothetical protein
VRGVSSNRWLLVKEDFFLLSCSQGGDGNHVFVVGGGERQFVIFQKK